MTDDTRAMARDVIARVVSDCDVGSNGCDDLESATDMDTGLPAFSADDLEEIYGNVDRLLAALDAAGLAIVGSDELARFRQAAEDRKRWLLQLHEVRCTDGGCLFRDPLAHIGMQTNGGCKCLHELRPAVRMALTQMLRQVQEERRWKAEQAQRGEEAGR